MVLKIKKYFISFKGELYFFEQISVNYDKFFNYLLVRGGSIYSNTAIMHKL